jgi:hypothetical protein
MQPSSEKIDDESVKFLQDVKKGKARKFVMIKEGVQIDRLYIFKKGPFDRFVRKAKQEGVRGEAFWGVVRGDGLDIHFELSRADGFENPPGKAIRLKEFLKEETSFKFEPDYVIVETLTPVDEAEGDATTEEDTSNESHLAEPGVVNADEEAGEKFIDLLKKILPHVKRALAKPTSVSEELQSRVREAQDLGRRREFQQGLATLRIVGQLTKQALAESEAAPAADGPARECVERSKTLRALARATGSDATSVAMEITRELEEADDFAQRNRFDRANLALERVERLIDLARAETQRRLQWQERFADVEPRYDEAVSNSTPEATQMRVIMDYATGQADRKQFVKALAGLDRLQPLLDAGT